MSVVLEVHPSLGPALVAGGGAIALRRTKMLVEGGFQVTVVSPETLPEFDALASAMDVRRVGRAWQPADLEGVAIAFACTDDREVNRAIGVAARAAGVLVGVADRQEESTIFVPATHRDGALTIAVSTGGASPTAARTIRDALRAAADPAWPALIEAGRAARSGRRGAAQ